MKAYKYLLIGALMLGSSVPTFAQNDNKSIIEQGTKVILAKGADYNDQVKQLYKANKKNPEVLVAFGKVFLAQKDTANAKAFANYALARNPKYAKAFLLKGDIAVSMDDAGGAAENYQQAKYFDPKDPEGYYKYAMILRGRSPEDAVSNLEDLRKQRPDYPVDALAGRIYYFSSVPNHFQKAESYFNKVQNIASMEDEDITRYAMTEFLLGNSQKSIDVAKAGLTKDARRAGWNRLVFWNYTNLNDSQNALDYADRLFNKSDSAHITADDYGYYGKALSLAKRYDEAITAYNKAIEDLAVDSNAIASKSVLLKNLSDVYKEKGDFNNSVAYLEKSIDAKDKPTMDDYDTMAGLYTDYASKKAAAGDKAAAASAFKKADEVYAKIMELFPNYKNYCNYMRGQINANLDPDSKAGLAKPYYEALSSSLEEKTELSSSEKAMLKQAYLYMLVYDYNVKKNTAGAKVWAKKLLVVDPENETAKQVAALK